MIELIELDRCRRDGGTYVECGGRALAVFRWGDPERIAVLDDTCPHAGGSLSGSEVEGGFVTCRWHQWKFDLETGVSTHSVVACVQRYRIEVRDGMIWVDLADA